MLVAEKKAVSLSFFLTASVNIVSAAGEIWIDYQSNQLPIRCDGTNIYGQMFFQGCLLPNCVVDPTLIRMTVEDHHGDIVRTAETPFIRPDLTPFLLHNYLSLRPGEECQNVEFEYLRMFDTLPRPGIYCKFSFTS